MTTFEGHPDSECGTHLAYGSRAWCTACSQWCYPDIERACYGCEVPALRHQVEQLTGRANVYEGNAAQLRAEVDEYDQLITRQSDLLTGVANALRGDPPELTWWDHSDLPARAREMMARVLNADAELAEALTEVEQWRQRCYAGWVPFGYHVVDGPCPPVVFDRTDNDAEDGMPNWEHFDHKAFPAWLRAQAATTQATPDE